MDYSVYELIYLYGYWSNCKIIQMLLQYDYNTEYTTNTLLRVRMKTQVAQEKSG